MRQFIIRHWKEVSRQVLKDIALEEHIFFDQKSFKVEREKKTHVNFKFDSKELFHFQSLPHLPII